MRSVVLERANELSIREIDLPARLGPHDVRIAIHTVGICGSDVHYYRHGAIGPFVVRQPMVLGHEASGTVMELGSDVTSLQVGDRVCMEPGVPDPNSRESRLGLYNLDRAVRFWATPPVHGCLTASVVHPEAFTFRLPNTVSFAAGAMVEPLAVGIHAVNKAGVRSGDLAVVIGAGPIGILTALAALAAGCGRVVITDVLQTRLDFAADLGSITPVNGTKERCMDVVARLTDGWGADIVFEASGSVKAAEDIFQLLCPGGRVVYIGMPGAPVAIDIVAAQTREARIETVFRYAHVFPRAISMLAGGKINVLPLISNRFSFDESIAAFDLAAQQRPETVKIQIGVA